MHCGKCGKKCSDDDVFCRFCGTDLKENTVDQLYQSEELSTTSTDSLKAGGLGKKGIIIAVIVSVLLIGVLAMYFNDKRDLASNYDPNEYDDYDDTEYEDEGDGSMTLEEATALEGYFILKGDKFYPLQQGQNCLYPSFSTYETMNMMTVYEDGAYPVPTLEEGDQLVLISSEGFLDEERIVHDVLKTGYTIPIFLEHYSLDDGILATATDEYYDDISTINGIDYETFLKEHTVDTADYCSISTFPRSGTISPVNDYKGCSPEKALILFDFENNSDVSVGTYQGTNFQEQHFQSNIKYYMYDGCAEKISTRVGEGVTAGYTFDYSLRGTMCPITMTQNGYAIVDASAVPSGLHLINIKDFEIFNNRWPMYPDRLYAFNKVYSGTASNDNSSEDDLESYVSNDETVRAAIEEASNDSLEVNVSGNEVFYTFNFSSVEGASEDLIKDKATLKKLEESLDGQEETFTDLCRNLESSTGCKGVKITVRYTYQGEDIISKTFTS